MRRFRYEPPWHLTGWGLSKPMFGFLGVGRDEVFVSLPLVGLVAWTRKRTR